MTALADQAAPHAAARTEHGRSARQRRLRLVSAGIAIAFFGAWELAARAGWIDAFLFPAPSHILVTFPYLWRNGLAANVTATLARFLGGVTAGTIAGVTLGLLIGASERARIVLEPFIYSIHPIPKIVLFPLLIVLFGVGEVSSLMAISLAVFFPTLINSAAAVQQISPAHFEAVQSYGGGRWATFRHVILPGSLPLILTGIRIAANTGLTVTISIEFAIEAQGVGSVLWLAWQTMNIDRLFAGIAVIALIGITVNGTIQWALRRLAPWQSARA